MQKGNEIEVMLDLETASQKNNAAILCLAAKKFTRKVDKKISCEDTFFETISLNSCKKRGLDISSETLEWWKKQSEKIRNEVFNGKSSLPKTLRRFSEWLGDENIKIWCQGTNFDIPILSNAYDVCGINIPWKYWNVRDTRTVFDIYGIRLSKNTHHPVSDCENQIKTLQKCFE